MQNLFQAAIVVLAIVSTRSEKTQIVTLKYSDGKLICNVEADLLARSLLRQVTWYKDNVDITDTNLLINPNTLSLSHVKDNDEHEYTCKFAYNLSSVYSDTMMIKRNKHGYPVIMRKQGTNTVSLEYDAGRLKCIVKPMRSPDTKITWYKDSEEINDSDVYVDDTTLDLKNVTDNKEHDYSCGISSSKGSQFSQHLLINGKAYIGLDMTNTSNTFKQIKLDENRTQNIEASCIVRSSPTADMYFLKNKEIVRPNHRINITKDETGNRGTVYRLSIRNISEDDVGDYHCLASNDFISKMITVKKIVSDGKCSPIHHWKCPLSSRCLPKANCKSLQECKLYHCEVPDEPKHVTVTNVTYNSATLSWYKDIKAIEYNLIADTDDSLSQMFSTPRNQITLADLKNNSQYSITIYASNKRGMSKEVYTRFKTTRMVPPQEIRHPSFVKDGVTNNNSAVFKWDIPEDDGMSNNDGDLYYQMKYCIYGHNETCESFITKNTTVDLSNMSYGQLYYISITAINSAGQEGKIYNMYYKNITTSTNRSSSIVTMDIMTWFVIGYAFLHLT